MLHQISGRERDLGGFSVRRVLPSPQCRMIGPFIFFDHMGPAQFAPGQGINVRPHPHINLATVTYLFEGEIHHRDSLGSDQIITPGAINWMTAGRGIVHSERTTAKTLQSGFRLDGIQLWVALPTEHEECEPSFSHHPADSFSEFLQDDATLKVLLGHFMNHRSPVPIHSDLFYVEVKIPKNGILNIPYDGRELGLYAVRGELDVNGENIKAYTMIFEHSQRALQCKAHNDVHLMLIGGQSVGERFIDWNFVSSSQKRIEEAKQLWQLGPSQNNSRFKPIPGDNNEWIPLPQK